MCVVNMATDRMLNEIQQQLILHEGLRLTPYVDTVGKLTIGVGRNLSDVGISRDEAMMLLRSDIADAVCDLHTIFIDFVSLPVKVQKVLIDMRFNLGPSRFRGFKRMIAAVKACNYWQAAEEMKDSRWFRQVGIRGRNLYGMMREASTGEFE